MKVFLRLCERLHLTSQVEACTASVGVCQAKCLDELLGSRGLHLGAVTSERLNAKPERLPKTEQICCQGALFLAAWENLSLLILPLTLKVRKSIRGGWLCQRFLRLLIGWVYFCVILSYFHCLPKEN